ncbi:TetR/AcrR family transcriptional regulator [Nocardia sp. SYP-A9097]|uniref:TetR/AcrR family transcriptional regulator n=1 Tax=Nocardia sp. SYP-A9097 TaxID=2663237 RepID=UPI0018915982|nr:TetR/AcrR family transcriptional regulator [Nocardia sp. SYP-A9097]
MSTQPVLSRRERTRAATLGEIKATALRLMRELGSADVRFSDIAREMGMTAPALYRYYGDRDALVTALISDAYDDLAGAFAVARDEVAPGRPVARLQAVASAFRSWARGEPQRFALIFGAPVPGYVSDSNQATEACLRATGALKAVFYDAAAAGVLGRPVVDVVDYRLARAFSDEHDPVYAGRPGLAPETTQALMQCWTSLYGFISLETYGHLDYLDEPARDSLFAAHVDMLARMTGLDTPLEKP